jgi:SAM-dependent methyltransferase
VVGIDATEAMLEQGRRFVTQHGIPNIHSEQGIVEALPFESESFDVVASRYAFHHFADPKPVLAEMARVCKPGGHLLIVDIVIPDESLRGSYDYYEWLCDPSHVDCLGFEELRALVGLFGFDVTSARARTIDEPVLEWMEFSLTSGANRAEILGALRDELAGGARTGLSPFERDGTLYFQQRDAAVVGRKRG